MSEQNNMIMKAESINNNKKAVLSFKLKRIIKKSKNYNDYYYPRYIRRRIKNAVLQYILSKKMHLDILDSFKNRVNNILKGMLLDAEDIKDSVVHFPVWYEGFDAYANKFDYKNPDSWKDPLLALIAQEEPDYLASALKYIGEEVEIRFVKNFVESFGCYWCWEEAEYPFKYVLVAEGKIGTIYERIKYLNSVIEEKGLYNFLESVYKGEYVIEPDLSRHVNYSYISDESSSIMLTKELISSLDFMILQTGMFIWQDLKTSSKDSL